MAGTRILALDRAHWRAVIRGRLGSSSEVIEMQRYLWLVILGSLITALPALAQDRNRPFTPSEEIQIPVRGGD